MEIAFSLGNEAHKRDQMKNIAQLEAFYRKCIKDLSVCLPEGILEVDLKFLQQHDLLDFEGEEQPPSDDMLTRYFHVVESDEKITLVNEQFAVWIVPESNEESSSTYTFIALNTPKAPKLELVFSVSGIYNTSRLVLRILERLLKEVQENEEAISKFNNKVS